MFFFYIQKSISQLILIKYIFFKATTKNNFLKLHSQKLP